MKNRVLEEMFVIALGKVVAEMRAAALRAGQRRIQNGAGDASSLPLASASRRPRFPCSTNCANRCFAIRLARSCPRVSVDSERNKPALTHIEL